MIRDLLKFLLPASLLLLGCESADEGETREAHQKLTPSEERTLRFELVNDWQVWSGQGTIQNNSLHSEGALSLKVTPTGTSSGFVSVRNLTSLTKDTQPAPEVVGFDVWIPSQQLNPSWHGDVQLSIDAPSAGIYQQYLGYRSFQNLAKGQFVRVEFPVANWIRSALNNSNYTDLRFVIAINTTPGNPAHYLDNFTLGPVPQNCTPVSDGNPCTSDECNPQTGQTTHVPLAPGALCGDGNVCNGTETCSGTGVCQAGTSLVVDDSNPCTADSCDPTTGVSHTPVSAGTACDDGDACNGAEFCDAAGECQDAPDLELDDGNPCTLDTCDPATGTNHVPVAAGTSCADGDVCNGEELCSAAGSCESGTPLVVDDENVCTSDSCDPITGVENAPVPAGTSCDDGNQCNGVSTCNAVASCVAGAPPLVDDGNACTADSCDPATGVSNIPVSAGISCGDGNACNGDETCDGAGACLAGTAPEVNDQNPCTVDACDPNGGVTHTPVSAGVSCGDGDACNGVETCDGAGVCQGGVPVDTDDGSECTIGSCDPATGIVTQDPVPAGAACGDGDICNGSEFCDGAGACASGTPLDPDDGNACTVDTCDPLFGIDNTPAAVGTSCVDGDVCNGDETCDGYGACQGGTPLEVDDGNACTVDGCDPLTGVVHEVLDDGTTCSDGDACTTMDSCQGGLCTGGDPIVCGALSSCHEAGACDPATGLCSDPEKPDGSACDDGVACTAGDTCEAGACIGGDSPVMEEAPCQVAECDGETGGVVYTLAEEGSTCQLDACTQGVCSAEGECLATETTVVDDLDPCTVDFCDPILGPVNVACADIDMTVATTVLSAYSWLFTGAFPVQKGVNPADIEERRAALISGTVTNLAGDPLPSVTVTVNRHPEFGQTVTQANGTFQMVVNGGGTMQVQFHKAGYLDSARRVDPKWNQTHTVDDVIMIVPDPVVTEISLDDAGEDFQVAQSSVVSDEDGERQGTLLVPPGTVATMRLPDGTEQMLDTMHVRITEFTVGPEGPTAMPATLPVNTAYTYAFEVNADEAVAAGAPSIEFSDPLVYYVENFIGFPVGETVPVGAYDRESGLWVPHDNGVVVEILSINAGVASVDLNGNGIAATPGELSAAGITTAELERLALLYTPGAQLWRVLVPHFTEPYDCNWPFHFPEDADPPPPDEPELEEPPPPENRCEQSQASTIECQAQVLRESVDVAGSSFSLNYSSARVPARIPSKFDITLTGDSLPASLKRVDLRVVVGGREFKQSFPPSPGQVATFDWDGMDAWGRFVQGRQTASVEVRYVYHGVYGQATRFNDPSLGHFPAGLSGNRARGELYISQKSTISVGGWLSEGLGLGGWTLSAQHYYDPVSGTLLRGDGTQVSQDARGAVVQNVLGEFPGTFSEGALARRVRLTGVNDFAVAPDGTVYLCWDSIYRIDPGGRMYKIRDSEQRQIACSSIAVGTNGDIYFRLLNSVGLRKMDSEGVVTPIAGASVGFPTEGALAAESPLGAAYVFATAPDGSVYIADESNRRIYRIGTDGILTRVAGVAQSSNSAPADGSEALTTPIQPRQIAVDERGVVHVVARAIWPGTGGTSAAIYSLGTDGLWQHIAGCRSSTNCSDNWNVPLQRARFPIWGDLAVGENGNIYFATAHPSEGSKLVVINRAGAIRSLIGAVPNWVPYMSGAPASQVTSSVQRMALGPQGVFLYGQASRPAEGFYALSLLTGMLPSLGPDEMLVPDESGSEVYHFDGQGRHVRTLHGHTYANLRTFEYEEHGFVSKVIDSNGLITHIERDSEGAPLAIVSPYGQRTALTVGADGYLSEVRLPAARQHSMTYDSGGLLTTYADPTGVAAVMTYDEDGRLVLDVDREGAPMSLARTQDADGWNVLRTTAEGRAFDYRVEYRDNNVEFTQNSFPDGTSSTTTRNAGGNSVTVLPDGTQVEVALQPDPSFGAMSPQSSTTRILPSGLSQTASTSRFVSLSEQLNPSSLTLLVDTTTVSGLRSETRFTRSDLRYRTTTPQGRISNRFIDQTGRTTRIENGGMPVIRTQYDVDKVSAIVVDPDTNPGNGNERVAQMFYDSSGRLTSVRDPMTNETFFGTFDEADRPQAITLPDESEVLMTYDVEGNVASVTPPGKAPHAMTYRSYGRIESYSPPVGNAVQFIYDQDRRMDLIDFGPDTFGQPNQVDFEYDATTHQLSTITSPTGVINVGYTNGYMTTLTAPSMGGSITTSIDYDGFLPTSLSWAGPVAGEVNWTYNDRFLIETETIGALPETTVNYEYDDDGLVTQAGDLEITRDPASGRVVQKTIGRIRETFEYNEFAELSRQTVEFLNADMTTVRETLYDVVYDDDGVNGDRDALGRITKKTEWIVSGDEPNGDGTPRALDSRTYDYGYNQEGRPWLESVAVDGSVVSSYSYDDNGNRTSVESSWSQLGYDAKFDVSLTEADTEYDSADKLLTYGTKSYAWNNFGQLESMTDSDPDGDPGTSDAETTFYQYDLFGNLLRVDLPDGRAIEYDVDGAGRRVGRRELDSNGDQLSFRGWIYRDLLRPIAEVDELGNVVARYVYRDGTGADQAEYAHLATRLGAEQDTLLPYWGDNFPEVVQLLTSDGSVGQTLRLVTNQVGSVIAVLDVGSGTVVDRIEYDSYGRVLGGGNFELQPFGFAGGLQDEATNLVRFGARDYDSSVGRWTARDPIQIYGQQLNYFAYYDPINEIDPLGLNPAKQIGGQIIRRLGPLLAPLIRPIKKFARRFDFDGPSAGLKKGGGRVCQVRFDKKPVARLDYHRLPGSNGESRAHLHFGSAEHNPIRIDPRSFFDD